MSNTSFKAKHVPQATERQCDIVKDTHTAPSGHPDSNPSSVGQLGPLDFPCPHFYICKVKGDWLIQGFISGLCIPNKQPGDSYSLMHSEVGEPLLMASPLIQKVKASSYVFREITSSFILSTSNNSTS